MWFISFTTVVSTSSGHPNSNNNKYNKNHSKSQQQKSSGTIFVPAGGQTRDLQQRLENQEGNFSKTRSAFSTKSYQPILLIFKSKDTKLSCLKFWRGLKQNCDRGSAAFENI